MVRAKKDGQADVAEGPEADPGETSVADLRPASQGSADRDLLAGDGPAGDLSAGDKPVGDASNPVASSGAPSGAAPPASNPAGLEATTRGGTLRRKLLRPPPEDNGPPAPVPERAIPLALARAARECLDLALRVDAIREDRMVLAELPETIEEWSLLMLVEGRQGALGIVAVSGPVLSALIEVQTTGRVGRAPPAPRRPTRMDAAMAAEWVEAMLLGIGTELSGTEAEPWAAGYRYASCLEDPRPLCLLLEDLSYRVWRLDMSLGDAGERRGGLLWAVPAQGGAERGASGPHASPRAPSRPAVGTAAGAAAGAAAGPDPRAGGGGVAPEADTDGAQPWQHSIAQAVSGVSAELEAVLHRVSLPLSQMLALRAGSELILPPEALAQVRIEAGGRIVASGRLGQHSGMRALRLSGERVGQAGPVAVPSIEGFQADPGLSALSPALAPLAEGWPEGDLHPPSAAMMRNAAG